MYRKFKADKLFTGHQMLQAGHVLVTDTTGIVTEIVHESDAGDDIEPISGILSPGLINCHCHLELSHMHGRIPKNTGLVDFVLKVVSERNFGKDQIQSAIAKAENEMFRNGIVAVGDICNTTNTIEQKLKRQLHYQNFIEVTGFIPANAETRLTSAIEVYEQFALHFNTNSIVPHAPYSVSPQLMESINNFSKDQLISIHNQETAEENKLFQDGRGDCVRMYEKMNIDVSFFKPTRLSSVQTWLPYFDQRQSVILVHNVATSQDDISFISKQSEAVGLNCYYCLCVNANEYITETLPPVQMFIDNDCKIVLGTDSLASNGELNIMYEIKTLLAKFPSLPLETCLGWATMNGATALAIQDNYGSFDKGKKPGLVAINEHDLTLKRIL